MIEIRYSYVHLILNVMYLRHYCDFKMHMYRYGLGQRPLLSIVGTKSHITLFIICAFKLSTTA